MKFITDNHNKKQDFLYVGDGADNSVKLFTLKGDFNGILVQPGNNVLSGPMGLIFDNEGALLISNQNVGMPSNGNVLKYNVESGAISQLVSSSQTGASSSPRGIVLYNNVLFVADFFASDSPPIPGDVRAYDGTNGVFKGILDHSCFCGQFYPRSLVIGPDGLLYASVRNLPDPLGGSVLRFDPITMKFLDVFIQSNNVNDLNRPEGLVFGPDGNLYIMSFRKDQSDTDKILIFDGRTGCYLDKIDLYQAGLPRVFAQAILFGPDGKLFVPITGGADNASDIGSIRRYKVHSKKFDIFVPADGTLGSPWYLAFGNTNPATLAYKK